MHGLCCTALSIVTVNVLLSEILLLGCTANTKVCGSEGVFDRIAEKFVERCTKKWIKNDLNDLESQLRSRLFGQHLATKMIATSIGGHIRNGDPPKALSISLHGSTGIGKTYVSELIANSLYAEGMKSKFVKRFYGQTDFHDDKLIHEYKTRVRRTIEECVSKCCQCLFIFDEIDKMPPGIFDSFTGYFDHYSSVHGLNYRKSIFLFISNIGSKKMVELMVSRWKAGLSRESLELSEVEPYLRQAVYNNDGGLQHSVLIRHSLLGTFIPFLPLEREHVKECIRELSKYRGLDEQALNKVTESLSYHPEDIKLFATTGCTSVLEKLYQHDEF